MLNSILLGILLTLVTIGIHALGTATWIRHLQARAVRDDFESRSGLGFQLKLLGSSAIVLLLLHILELTVWAVVYYWWVATDQFRLFEDAVYFSTVTFASLGYGDIVIEGSWRLLSAIQAMAGLFVFGWSTALLFAVVQRIWLADEMRARSRD
ncbi:MAG: potassium channel family protein [Planctomycetota bacterium]